MLNFGTLSIRTKLLSLVVGVASLMGGASAVYSFVRTNTLLREEVVKRGRYVAHNLALNSYIGILTEDKPILTAQMENALSAGTEKKGGAEKKTEQTAADTSSDSRAAPLEECTWSGTWRTTYGTMTLTQAGSTVSGHYDSEEGDIQGTVVGSQLVGTWGPEPSTAHSCKSGDLEFTMASTCNSFSGTWWYCHGGARVRGGGWSGTRL